MKKQNFEIPRVGHRIRILSFKTYFYLIPRGNNISGAYYLYTAYNTYTFMVVGELFILMFREFGL